MSYHFSQQTTSLDLTFPAGYFICVFLMGLYTANHNPSPRLALCCCNKREQCNSPKNAAPVHQCNAMGGVGDSPVWDWGCRGHQHLAWGRCLSPVPRQFCSFQSPKAEKINGFVSLQHSKLHRQPTLRGPNRRTALMVENTLLQAPREKSAFLFGLWTKGKAAVWPVDQTGGQLQRRFSRACFHVEMYMETERSH